MGADESGCRIAGLHSEMMFRAFLFRTDAGGYWSVVDDNTYETVDVADAFLQYMRFGRGRTESTSRKYAEAVALYFGYCLSRGSNWTDPNMTAFQMWLRVAPSPRLSARAKRNVLDAEKPVRSDNHINLISYVVTEMFKFAAAEGLWPPDRLSVLFETAQVRLAAGDRGPAATRKVVLRRRHRLRARPARRRDAPIDVVKALLAACTNSRDVFLVALLATTGLRRGEALGVRLSDLHLLPASTVLGCPLEGPHLHVVPRDNSNSARVKNDRPRSVPVTSGLVSLFESYRAERDRNPAARDCDFLFVNLYRAPFGEPMKLHAANELFVRLSRRVGTPVSPHMLRHTFGTEAAQAATLDVVAEILGHANLQTTQTYLHPNIGKQRDAIRAGALSQHLHTMEGST